MPQNLLKSIFASGSHRMNTINVIPIIAGMIIIGLAGIAVVVIGSTSLLSVQSVSATTDLITGTTVGGEEGATMSGNTTTTNTDSNVTLGNVFHIGQTIEETFNPINETYFVISFVDRVTLMPPNATTTINATERGNVTITVLPNGLYISQGQGFMTTEGDDGQEETATTTSVSLGRTDAEGTTGSATGVVFFSTNSTGQLAFLNNMVGISQLEFSPEETIFKTWEWKGGGTLAPILE